MKPQSKFIKFDGLGTRWECELFGDITDDKLCQLRELLVAELTRFTKLYSRFDEDSLISRLNKQSELHHPPAELRDMLLFSKKMFDDSEGVFNISVGGVLNAKGYGKVDLTAKVNLDFWQSVIIDDDLISIPNGSVIDFGGFGKGWLIDEFAQILRDKNIDQFIVNGGGDLFVQSDELIEIALEHPMDSSKKIGQTRIGFGALAASSTLKRVWTHSGNNYNHIINPFSGESSDNGVIGTFVKADTALIADVVATILIVEPNLNDVLTKKYNLQTIILTADQIKS